jgi:hypothetical protein
METFLKSLSELILKWINGTPSRIRTCDPLLRRQMLYPTELWAHSFLLVYRKICHVVPFNLAFRGTVLKAVLKFPSLNICFCGVNLAESNRMKKTMGCISIIFIYVLISAANASQAFATEPAAERFQIDVVIVDPGAELFERWGHISIVVTDRIRQIRTVYDFGTYSFDEPGILLRYARGFLDFQLSTSSYEPSVQYYISQSRGVISRTLNLTAEQAVILAGRLEENALPDNRIYAYRHYLDNCCTRIRDLLNGILGGSIKEEFDTAPTGRTYRYYTARALEGLPVMRNVILFILGREIDKPITRWDEQFLPEVFGEDLDRITVPPDNKPLVARKQVLYGQGKPRLNKETSKWEVWVSGITLAMLVLGFGTCLAFQRKRWNWTRRAAGLGLFIWGLIGGFGGLVLILFWTVTAHYDCHNNENVLVFPFLHLWLLGPGLVLMLKGKLGQKTNRGLQRYLIACLAILGISLLLKLGLFSQENYQFIAFAAILNTASLLSLRLPAKD